MTAAEIYNYTMDSEDDVSQSQLFVITSLSIIGCILGTIGNALVITAIIKGNLYKQASFLKILNLSTCNLIQCAIFLPLMVLQAFTGVWTHNTALCNAVSFGLFSNLGTELFGYVCITLNRYIYIVHHRFYSRFYGSMKMLILQWIIGWIIYPIILAFPLFGIFSHYEYAPQKLVCHPFLGIDCTGYCLFVFILSLATAIPMIYCYIHIIVLYMITQHRLNLTRESSNSSNDTLTVLTGHHKLTRSELKMALTILAVFVVFGICRLPFIILYMYDPSMSKLDPLVHSMLIFLGTSSNWINPIIYSFTNEQIRVSINKLLIN